MSSQPSRTSQTQTDSDEEDQHPRAHSADPGAEITRLKRRLAASQEEVQELLSSKAKKPPYVDFSFSFFLSNLLVGLLLRWGAAFDAWRLYMTPLTTLSRQLMTTTVKKTKTRMRRLETGNHKPKRRWKKNKSTQASTYSIQHSLKGF